MEELLTVVDENDNLIKGEERKKVHSSTFWHRGIHVFVFNNKGEMLVPLRSSVKDKYPNMYDCSVSGNITLGEDYETTTIRELEEELGIRNVKIKPILYFRFIYSSNDYHISKLFKCVYDGKIKINDEVSKIEFFKMDNLKKLVKEKPEIFAPYFLEMLRWYFKMDNKLHIFKTY